MYTVLQSHKEITAYLKSKRLLPSCLNSSIHLFINAPVTVYYISQSEILTNRCVRGTRENHGYNEA